jgi:TRAP-type C4-dicarboxylate transport system substrate-binding protein
MNFNRRSIMAAALAGAALFSNGLSATAQTQLNMSDVLPESNFMVKNATRFSEEVSAATGGEVLISVKPGGSMASRGRIS